MKFTDLENLTQNLEELHKNFYFNGKRARRSAYLQAQLQISTGTLTNGFEIFCALNSVGYLSFDIGDLRFIQDELGKGFRQIVHDKDQLVTPNSIDLLLSFCIQSLSDLNLNTECNQVIRIKQILKNNINDSALFASYFYTLIEKISRRRLREYGILVSTKLKVDQAWVKFFVDKKHLDFVHGKGVEFYRDLSLIFAFDWHWNYQFYGARFNFGRNSLLHGVYLGKLTNIDFYKIIYLLYSVLNTPL